MRAIVSMVLVMAACADDGPSSAERKMVCGEARDCTPDDRDCTQYAYEQLPTRCFDICYWGECCDLDNGHWQKEYYHCQRPVDAGIDTP
ncbi:MAG: hypothetical protein JNL83_07495 [Myxococcales bacterium]|nr:hypothetical protein [Myxococcales bacterium]